MAFDKEAHAGIGETPRVRAEMGDARAFAPQAEVEIRDNATAIAAAKTAAPVMTFRAPDASSSTKTTSRTERDINRVRIGVFTIPPAGLLAYLGTITMGPIGGIAGFVGGAGIGYLAHRLTKKKSS